MYSRLGQDTSTPPTSDFLNVTGGISAILAPLAQVGVSIYQTNQLQKLEKARMKAEVAAQNAMAMMPQGPVVVQSSSGLLIGVIVGGAVLMGLLVFMLTHKKDGEVRVSSTIGESHTAQQAQVHQAPQAPRIKRIKRISRPKNSY